MIVDLCRIKTYINKEIFELTVVLLQKIVNICMCFSTCVKKKNSPKSIYYILLS